ncbi:acyltransferase [Streptococcus sp. S784/96/1]|uniref:acyltransferase n=1 Tax=Streptococcus sp. S784/96/1 TaxID=2653499 RepID=UPI0013871D96|nr:acyltransferase [Streptococcus sp. S784/96/1]
MIAKIVKYIMSVPKTLYFNFTVLPFKEAVKLPFLISYDLKLVGISKETINIEGPISRFMIRLNFDQGSEGINIGLSSRGYLYTALGSKIKFRGPSTFTSGLSIRVDSGLLSIGENVYANKGIMISCSSEIVIGNNTLIGWNVVIRDSDGHNLLDESSNLILNSPRSILIGSSTWIAANVTLLKGSKISKNSVVGYNSCVTKSFTEENVVIAGYPAKVLKKHVSWKK